MIDEAARRARIRYCICRTSLEGRKSARNLCWTQVGRVHALRPGPYSKAPLPHFKHFSGMGITQI